MPDYRMVLKVNHRIFLSTLNAAIPKFGMSHKILRDQFLWPAIIKHFLLLYQVAMESSQNRLDHIPMHIGQTKIAALIAIRKSFVVIAQAVQNRGIEVVNMHWVAGDVIAVIVGLPVHMSGANSAAGKPHGITAAVMIAAVVFLKSSLAVNRAAKFTAPDNQSVLQHSSLL